MKCLPRCRSRLRETSKLEASGKRDSGMDTSFVICEFALMFGGFAFGFGFGLGFGLGFI